MGTSTGVKLWIPFKHEGKLGQISYLVCRCTLLKTRRLLFFMDVKGHLGSTGVKLWKTCKHDMSRREAWTDLINLVCRCTLLSARSLLVFVEVKGHLESTRVKNLVNWYSKTGNFQVYSHIFSTNLPWNTSGSAHCMYIRWHSQVWM